MKFYNTKLTERIGYDFYCDIAERIVEGRKQKRWKQSDLAEKSGLSRSRIFSLERVQIRVTLSDVEKISKALDVSVDWLIDANLDNHGNDCLYLVWNERVDSVRFFQKASSARMAFLKFNQRVCSDFRVRWLEPRDRAIVRLVGIPVSADDLEAVFPKRTGEEDDLIEPNV